MATATDLTPPPDWLQGIRFSLGSYQQFILSGNVHDVFRTLARDGGETRTVERPVQELLAEMLLDEGIEAVAGFDVVDGFSQIACRGEGGETVLQGLGIRTTGGTPADFTMAARAVTRGMAERPEATGPRRVALIVSYAGRLTNDPGHLETAEADRFANCLKLANVAPLFPRGTGAGHAYNPLFWIVDRDIDLPAWFATGSPRIRAVTIPLPTMAQRLAAARAYVSVGRSASEQTEERARGLADAADNLPLRSIAGIRQVALRAGLPLDELAGIQEAARVYRLGVHDNPWREDLVRAKLATAAGEINRYVKGQDGAVARTLAGLARAALGLSGAHTASSSRRPRGVFMFAGPTGVGKTELVKSVARVLFGHEDSCIRFDMSEFSAEHSDQRLLGAPPGYIGHDAGGELTNAVRARPFSALLFDEIEKAHPLILDKFLQILEDGRLTDGRGRTTYFSEALIFFTTNLGIYEERVAEDSSGGSELTARPSSTLSQWSLNAPKVERVRVVDPDMSPQEMEETVRKGIARHFTARIGRPEILNRLGENIIVFQFIDRTAAEQILRDMVDRVCATVRREHGVELRLSRAALSELHDVCMERLPDFGGRGIGNVVEQRLIAPLALRLLSRPQGEGGSLQVDSLAQLRTNCLA